MPTNNPTPPNSAASSTGAPTPTSTSATTTGTTSGGTPAVIPTDPNIDESLGTNELTDKKKAWEKFCKWVEKTYQLGVEYPVSNQLLEEMVEAAFLKLYEYTPHQNEDGQWIFVTESLQKDINNFSVLGKATELVTKMIKAGEAEREKDNGKIKDSINPDNALSNPNFTRSTQATRVDTAGPHSPDNSPNQQQHREQNRGGFDVSSS